MKRTLLSITICLSMIFSGCKAQPEEPVPIPEPEPTLKYIFLFIGDGMSYGQIQLTSDYLGSLDDKDYEKALPSIPFDEKEGATLQGPVYLNFMNFETSGSAVNYDSSSFIPNSSSTGTTIASGQKTHSSMVGVTDNGVTKVETIAEQLKNKLGFKVALVTTANINHATPAAFYAHNCDRTDYYNIGKDLISSNFDFIYGGPFAKAKGAEGEDVSLYELAKKAGYLVVQNDDVISVLSSKSPKAIAVDEICSSDKSLSFELDRIQNPAECSKSLADHVKKAIDVVDNETGFFIMVEAGKIDYACHANDATAAIYDVLALNDAVDIALQFKEAHPDETLIIVTADHETGGLSIGYAQTKYDTYLSYLSNQKISYEKFVDNYVHEKYFVEKTKFEDAMLDVYNLFGLKTEAILKAEATVNNQEFDSEADYSDDRMLLNNSELAQLKTAYELSKNGYDFRQYTDEQHLMYSTYDPFTTTILHILEHKCGIDFTTYSHTGLPVPVFATGFGANDFDGYYDNSTIYNNLYELTGLKELDTPNGNSQ